VSVKLPNTDAYCAEPAGDETGVRGAQNAPVPDEPTSEPGQGADPDEEHGGEQDGDDDADRDVTPLAGDGKRDAEPDDDGLPGMLELSQPGELGDSVAALLGSDERVCGCTARHG